MKNNRKQSNLTGMFIWMVLLLNVIILKAAYLYHHTWYWWLAISVPLLFTVVVYARRRA